MKKTDLCKLLNIELPIIQAGMVWVSGANLAAASANAGCLGVIGAGSMTLELLDQQLQKANSKTNKPLAVNLPIMYEKVPDQIEIALKNKIKIFITSAGSPKKYTDYLKSKGAIVIHVISNPEMALKCEDAGVDAIIAEGFEAGGHNGREELTSLVLIPSVVDVCSIPVIAAGGFGTGASIVSALSLGASGVQMGTRFLMTKESSAHQNYKDLLLETNSSSTKLMMKNLMPVRLVKNNFYEQVLKLENNCATKEELEQLLGSGRARRGMLEGDLVEGELEAGQVCALIKKITSVSELVSQLKIEYESAKMRI